LEGYLAALEGGGGGVESLIEVPAAMTHASTAGTPLQVDPGLARLSISLKHVDDLVDDLQEVLQIEE